MVPITNSAAVESLFAEWQETMIWSCLQGRTGSIYANAPNHPQCAVAMLGDFVFFAGSATPEAVVWVFRNRARDFGIWVPQTQEWARAMEECLQTRAKRITRYAFRKENGAFDAAKLQAMVDSLPAEFSLWPIEETLFEQCRRRDWSRDFGSQFENYESYRENGLGVVIVTNGEPVAGASSYSVYDGGIEIEVDTKVEYRRRGLGTICAAKLILMCLERGLYPSWDAHNRGSASLAQKLGYHLDHEYTAYEVRKG